MYISEQCGSPFDRGATRDDILCLERLVRDVPTALRDEDMKVTY